MRKPLAILLAILLTFSCATACAAPAWINSDVENSVTAAAEIRVQDDLSAAVNRDWLATAVYPQGGVQTSTFGERAYEVRDQILALITGDPLESAEGKLVQTLYNLYVDMDARNALGMSPVMPYVEAIQAIQTLDDLTAYMLRRDVPYRTLFTTEVEADYKDSEHNMVAVMGRTLLLGDADEYQTLTAVGARYKEALTGELIALLGRVGYGEDEARGMAENVFAFEALMAAHDYGNSVKKQPDYYERIYNRVTLEELQALSPRFPIADVLREYIDAGVNAFVLYNPEDLANVNALYTEENLETIKNYFLCRTLLTCSQWLDQECMDATDAGTSILAGTEYHSLVSDLAYNACNDALSMAVGQMYVESYVPASVKEDVTAIVGDVLAVFRHRLETLDWMSDETRAFALEKLDQLTVRVAYPDDWTPYTHEGLTLRTYAEGGNLIEAALAISHYNFAKTLRTILDPIDHTQWQNAPQTVNAFYNPTDNSINILSGVLGGALYSADASYEEKLGTVGYIVGHEITHGFDTIGSQFDKDGNMLNWWTEADSAAFKARTDKVQAYYSAIETLPGQFVDGQLTIGETVADLGGLSCMLELAAASQGFDYQAFFESFARTWRTKEPQAVAEMILHSDPHAPGYLRTNVTAQQFQEFYDAYGVTEGDGMYLAPEERLRVW